MLKNYLKIALRNLLKYKLHTGINIIGLTLGLGVSILIFFFVQFESSYDKFHTEKDQIFRLRRFEGGEGEGSFSYSTPIITAPTFASEFPQVEAVTRYIGGASQAYLDESTTQNQNYFLVSADFLKIFDFELLRGDRNQVLQEKFGVVITESCAQKYFGDSNPIGQSIRMKMGDNYEEYQVTGLLKDIPGNSSLQFEMLINDENLDFTVDEQGRNNWFHVFGDTFIKTNDPLAKASIEEGSVPMMKKVLGEEYEEGAYRWELQPMSEIHLTDDEITGQAETTRPSLLYILAGIAFLILLIASINFTTMAIGRSVTRAKEVGVRKTMGAGFSQLMFQFLTEAFLTTLIALVLGLMVAELLVPTFNSLFEKDLDLVYQPTQIAILVGLVVLITAMAGAYPSFFMSNLRPIKVLKGNLSIRFGKQGLRKGLVAFQFFISFLLIASTLIMVNQMKAIRNYDLGFDKEMVVIVEVPGVSGQNLIKNLEEGFGNAETYRQALIGRSEVQSAGISIATYGDESFWDIGFETEEKEQFNFRVSIVGGDYFESMGMEMAEGRGLNPDIGADSSAFVINETFAKALNWEDPLGEMLPNTEFESHQIVGVVKDFNHNSLYREIEPLLLAKSPKVLFSGINTLMIHAAFNPKVLVKGSGTDFEAFKSVLESEWSKVFPMETFSFSFMDEKVQNQYKADERLGKMVFFAAGIAILIATMGLFAMAALSIAGRTKEIGIRKVLGASSLSISWMFNREFLAITIAGVLIALPLSLYLMQSWIAQFAVKDWPSWINFVLLTIAGVGFTLLIVSAQAFRATQMNPVDTLKDE
ncbi:ABC transporter permease [Algoriphagus vanfongensis]|uniref:ABC transporter permease n=1 Tax=Algoriphagus vanfongensis TaxID=426371 RepID=UPI000401C927|nr:ABC transporter permease [Algoriphagus vanfongensis]